MLFFFKKDDLSQKVQEALATRWLASFGGMRLCPYCSQEVAPENSADMVSLFLKHFSKCPKWQRGTGEELAKNTLETMALRCFVKNNLAKGGAWTVFDEERRWICPFSAEVTSIQLETDNKITGAIIDEMVRHLSRLHTFSPLRPPKEESYLRKVAAELKKRRTLEDKIRASLANDPALRYRDAKGRWVCPWCKGSYESVDVSTDFARRNSAPHAIAEHLLYGCGAYRANLPKMSVAELDALFAAPAKSNRGSDTTILHAAMLDEIKGDIETLRTALTETQKVSQSAKEMEQSLAIARQRQLKMLPSVPEIVGLSLHVWYAPCASVSGDFYDFIKVNDRSYGVLIGDVSGHGIEAALVMSMAKKALQMHGRGLANPMEALTAANADLCQELAKGTFLTVGYAIFDLAGRTARLCRAGHNPIIMAKKNLSSPLPSMTPSA